MRASRCFGERSCRLLIVLAVFMMASSASWAQYITGVTARATSSQVFPASVLVNDAGLTETPPGSGIFGLTTNSYADGGAMWVSGYQAWGGDENPYVEFDLGAPFVVRQFHVWNHNSDGGYTFRGFRDVTVQHSLDGVTWTSMAQRFRFVRAPGIEGYTGERYDVTYPASARYIRFIAENTYRDFPANEIAGLGKVRFVAGGSPATPPAIGGAVPSDAGVINVRLAPYGAIGDGVADDSLALERALRDWQGSNQRIYLPAGIYRVTRSIRPINASGFGFTTLMGDGPGQTVIRLADNTFTNPAQTQAVLSAGYNGIEPTGGLSADWFNVNYGQFTIDVGRGNSGAVGLEYYSNNFGALRDVEVISQDGLGAIGIDFAYANQNGPFLAKNISVRGFDTGIRAGYAVNSLTLENVTLRGQRVVGLINDTQCLSLRGLVSENSVTAVNNQGHAALVGATLHAPGPASVVPAIINGESLRALDVVTGGYAGAIRNDFGGAPSAAGPVVRDFVSHPTLSLFSNTRVLRLSAPETPDSPIDAPAGWANVRNFRRVTDPDDTLAIQRAIDSGATTVYFPSQGNYLVGDTVIVRGNVRRIVGMSTGRLRPYTPSAGFRIEGGTASTVFIEDFGGIGATTPVTQASSRTLVLRNLGGIEVVLPPGSSSVFIENVATAPMTINGQRVWARQLNIETDRTKVVNQGGRFWALGFKSEDKGTLVETRMGGRSEVLGGLYYSRGTDAAPMFVAVDSAQSLSLGEINYSFQPFINIVRETRLGTTNTLTKPSTPQRKTQPGSMLPLFAGWVASGASTPGEAAGSSVAPLRVTSYSAATGDMTLTFGVPCGATNHNIHAAPLAALGAPARWTESRCNVGSSGTVSGFNPGSGSWMFVVVAHDGTIEGSYGRTSSAIERTPASGAVCGQVQDLNERCDPTP